MRILLIGSNGQVGWELQRALAPLGELHAFNRAVADLTRPDELRQLVERIGPSVIINAAAYTAVDKAQSEPELARRINALAVGELAGLARDHGAWLVHYSTDYVFDGRKDSPYLERDEPNPLGIYGRTKLEGEQLIQQSGCQHLILRTSWVYAARGSNFAKTMLRLAAERDALRVVADQVGAPTSADLIADVTAQMLRHLQLVPTAASELGGLYHLSASGQTTWHGFASFSLAQAELHGLALKVGANAIEPITTADYPVPAPRPANSRLDCAKLRNTFRLELPNWELSAERILSEILKG